MRYLLFFILVFFCQARFPQYIGAQQMKGRVTFIDGSSCANATVLLTNNLDPSKRSSAKTDNSGNYSIDLPNKNGTDLSWANASVDKPSKKINFNIGVKESTTLNITLVDLLGRECVQIYTEKCNAGEYRFSWDYSPYAIYLDNHIYIINFQSSQTNKSVKLIQSGQNRIDFYAEASSASDFEQANTAGLTYTATIEGAGFKPHIIRHINASVSPQNFVVNNDVWVPFRCGGTFIGQYNGDKYQPIYIKGINLGAAIPGTSPAEMAPTAQQYASWFKMMSEAGYNLIRVYTLHYPRFYDELKRFNDTHPATPLYLMHGAWLDEEYEGFDTNPDLYNSQISYVKDINVSTTPEKMPIWAYFDERIEEVIDVVHGNATLPERWGWASGQYTADVSPWLLGYIVGREIYANEVVQTNKNNPSINTYQGDVFGIANASPTEAWATQRLDLAMTYERAHYAQQHPISFSSWPTLDPIDHPTENSPEDMVSLNLDGIDETNAPAGYFASYHVYPYYPDFLVCDPDYRQYRDDMGENSYLGYLNDLKAQYAKRPLIISEFGVASSWGSSRFSTNGMHHGGLTEQQQGEYIVRMMHNIQDANCGGGILFSWIDEWFKYVWIFGQTTNPSTRQRWHNIYSAEENYGLISFIPEQQDYSAFNYTANEGVIKSVGMDADIEGLYLKLSLTQKLSATDTLWIALDTYNASIGESVLPNNKTVNNRAEFCVAITTDNAQLYVTKAYDMYGIGQSGFPKAGQLFRSVAADGKGWNKVKWKNHRDASFCAGSVFDAGNLRVRDDKMPIRSDAVVFDKNNVMVKLPWGIINFNDPSQLLVSHITDYSSSGGTNNTQTYLCDGIAATIFLGTDKAETPRFVWQKWTEYAMPKTVEYKKSSFYIVKKALKQFAADVE
jgi:hypothetical protein